jgi:hypothetical protein
MLKNENKSMGQDYRFDEPEGFGTSETRGKNTSFRDSMDDNSSTGNAALSNNV